MTGPQRLDRGGRSGRHVAQPSGSRARAWGVGAVVALVVAPVVVVLGLYLSPYVLGRVDTPIGGDTPWYIARQRLVAEQGLDAIGEGTGQGPRRPKTLGDRPGYPVVA